MISLIHFTVLWLETLESTSKETDKSDNSVSDK